ANWPKGLTTQGLLTTYPDSRKLGRPAKRNTTISLVVTNQKLAPAQLQRLATQVHSSIGRAIQPFSTEYDGDVLYAVSTGELAADDKAAVPALDLDVLADEVMWDAVLAAVPEQPDAAVPASAEHSVPAASLAGEYVFSPFVTVRISLRQGRLWAQATGARDAYAIPKTSAVELLPLSATLYALPGRYPLQLNFDAGKRLIINPGHWQQVGIRR
ncbi:MAG: P1 family peptidase, partial [Proteobacteria bacterium]|nr:P1 family peptidase [Pseudomonadota bacterium]